MIIDIIFVAVTEIVGPLPPLTAQVKKTNTKHISFWDAP